METFKVTVYTDHEYAGLKRCVCCATQDVNVINLKTCKHTSFLHSFCKIELKRRNTHYVCILCHTLLKKIEEFRQQITDTNGMRYASKVYARNPNTKNIHNLSISSIYTTDSTEPPPLPIVTKQPAEPFDFETKLEVHEIIVAEDDELDVYVKVEQSSDVEDNTYMPTEPPMVTEQLLVTKPSMVPLPSRVKEPVDPYEGAIRCVVLTVDELEVERKANATQEKYLKLPYKCKDCVVGFDHEITWKQHLQQRHTMYEGALQCEICKSVLCSKSSYNEHTRKHLRRFECMACGKRYINEHSVVRHYDAEHMTEGKSIGPTYTCDECGFTTTKHRTFRYHTYKHKNKIECNKCANTFMTKNSLKQHMFTIHGESSREYKCDDCNKKYRAKSGLKAHMRSVHGSPEGAYCSLCRTHYKTKHGLLVHQTTHSAHVTDSDKRYICDYCGLKVVRKSFLTNHILLKHLQLLKYVCPTCNKGYVRECDMNRHIKYVHKKFRPPRSHMCHFCGRGFTTLQILQSHVRTHTGERPLVCKHCNATFGHPSALYTHTKLKHKKKQ